MKFKPVPLWRIGGYLGIIYFFGTLFIDFFQTGVGPESGMITILSNIPGAWVLGIIEEFGDAMGLSLSSLWLSIAVYCATNFLIGAAAGLFIQFIIKIAQPKS